MASRAEPAHCTPAFQGRTSCDHRRASAPWRGAARCGTLERARSGSRWVRRQVSILSRVVRLRSSRSENLQRRTLSSLGQDTSVSKAPTGGCFARPARTALATSRPPGRAATLTRLHRLPREPADASTRGQQRPGARSGKVALVEAQHTARSLALEMRRRDSRRPSSAETTTRATGARCCR